MKIEEQLTICGFFRPRPKSPGFAIPVLSRDSVFFVQRTEKERIVGFSSCSIETKDLVPIIRCNNSQKTLLGLKVGESRIYAFQMPNGTISCGDRKYIQSEIRSQVAELRKHPFLFSEVAAFLKDSRLVQEARRETDKIFDAMSRPVKVVTKTELRIKKDETDSDIVKSKLLADARNTIRCGKYIIEPKRIDEPVDKMFEHTKTFIGGMQNLVNDVQHDFGSNFGNLPELMQKLKSLKAYYDRGANAIKNTEIAKLVKSVSDALQRLLNWCGIERV